MTAEQRALFCVWAGEGGRYADAFVRGAYVAIGWPEVQDLHRVDSYDELRERLQEAYPNEPSGRVRNYLGQIGNFVLKMHIGDLVITPCPDHGLLRVGEVISYPFKVLNVDESSPYPHRRKVEWGMELRRSDLPDAVLRSLGSSQAVFRIEGAGAWLEANGYAPFSRETDGGWGGAPDSHVPALLEVEPREGYRLWLRYDNGVCGEVDMSDTPRTGVFAAWNDRVFFATAHLDGYGAVVWGEDEQLDACADYLYMRLTGKSAEELMPGLRSSLTDA
ncbi:MAG: DUF2442 domain-containing protein [Chloroflexota bacterium]|nr:DUF2442 domain-containing protein [Chloroflexota bacterium]MDE2885601.1 DUF2442 domain-containing protein [Chloroflexota bacterium]